MLSDWIYWLDLIGVFVFATSGALTAIDNEFDIVGSTIVGFITALGGGTLRDMMIGKTPVGWMTDTNYLWTVALAVAISYLFKRNIMRLKKGMFFFDTIGIGVFTILSVQKTIQLGLPAPVVLMMGVVSAVFGGVIRDVLTNEIPFIFRKEVYASACLLGGLIFYITEKLGIHHNINMLVSMSVVIVIRYLSVRNGWTLRVKAR